LLNQVADNRKRFTFALVEDRDRLPGIHGGEQNVRIFKLQQFRTEARVLNRVP
jgi:hypothetical protein